MEIIQHLFYTSETLAQNSSADAEVLKKYNMSCSLSRSLMEY